MQSALIGPDIPEDELQELDEREFKTRDELYDEIKELKMEVETLKGIKRSSVSCVDSAINDYLGSAEYDSDSMLLSERRKNTKNSFSEKDFSKSKESVEAKKKELSVAKKKKDLAGAKKNKDLAAPKKKDIAAVKKKKDLAAGKKKKESTAAKRKQKRKCNDDTSDHITIRRSKRVRSVKEIHDA